MGKASNAGSFGNEDIQTLRLLLSLLNCHSSMVTKYFTSDMTFIINIKEQNDMLITDSRTSDLKIGSLYTFETYPPCSGNGKVCTGDKPYYILSIKVPVLVSPPLQFLLSLLLLIFLKTVYKCNHQQS